MRRNLVKTLQGLVVKFDGIQVVIQDHRQIPAETTDYSRRNFDLWCSDTPLSFPIPPRPTLPARWPSVAISAMSNRLLPLLCMLAAAPLAGIDAAGVAITKEQDYHRDESARAITYRSMLASQGPT
jgi:hypothetical protein